jgi:tetratricopeptide (TPR) repeat protein
MLAGPVPHADARETLVMNAGTAFAHRRRIPRVIGIGAFALAALSASITHAEIPDFAARAEWVQVRTPHLTVASDCGFGPASEAATRIERVLAMLKTLYPELRSDPALPARIYVFRNTAEMSAYSGTQLEQAAAFFFPGTDFLFLVTCADERIQDRGASFCHEFVHSWQYGNFQDMPVWMREGMADYISTARFSGSEVEIGQPPRYYSELLKNQSLLTLDLMFAIDAGAAAYRRSNSIRDIFYLESWAMTHYLACGDTARSARFSRVLDRLRQAARPRLAFGAAFPSDTWATMVSELPAYVEHVPFMKLPHVTIGAVAGSETFESSTLTRAEALVRLGELMSGLRQHAAAAEHFRSALALDGRNAEAAASLATAEAELGDTAAARRDFALARSLGPANPRVLVLSARDALTGIDENAVDSGTLARTRADLLQVLAQEPANVTALAEYGRSYLNESRPEARAVAGLQTASAMLPARTDLALALTLELARAGRVDEANRIVTQRLESTIPPSRLAALREELARIAARSAAPATADARVAGGSEGTSRSAEVVHPVPGGAASPVERFNRAVAAARNGDLDEALELAESIPAHTEDAELVARAQDMARQLRYQITFSAGARCLVAHDAAGARRHVATLRAMPLESGQRANVDTLEANAGAMAGVDKCMALVRAGKLEEARATMVRLLNTPVSAGSRAYLKAHIKELDSALGRK